MKKHLKMRHSLILSMVVALIALFQNCSEVSFSKLTSAIELPSNVEGFVSAEQTVVINTDDAKLDILFVVDNSGSMINFQNNMKNRIDGFINHVSHLNYQIAVTSTDKNLNTRDANGQTVAWGDGQFRSFVSGTGESLSILSPNSGNASQAQQMLGNAIQMGRYGDGDERGVNAIYRAIERRYAGHDQATFFRDGSALVVVLISDEDECSNAGCLPSSPKSRPSELMRYVDAEFGNEKLFTVNSIIHQQRCTDSHAEARVGTVYQELSLATGGIVGDVCASDYASQLSDIGRITESLIRTVRLECAPADIDGDSKPDIKITKNGAVTNHLFVINGDRLVFEHGLPNGEYKFEYFCTK